ncbi:RibD family protein [Natronospirillum operosum]|uniref:RibD family protein n=1 Tax=Natronospirillum operosum TaxID=2759953 RepID=A0A4Z0WDV2_9GAMM|nr:RibD family protein [Natronospirillum operosum]TGG92108.1 RibD family protein [Natronospirillum operosum]
MVSTFNTASISVETAWQMLLGIVAGNSDPNLKPGPDGIWTLAAEARSRLSAEAEQLLDLYLPLCRAPGTAWVMGQLGQSLDGRIATSSGESRYINDTAGITHLHRLRALVDAVIVGAGTAQADDPQLTVRAVPGSNPVRVVLDRSRCLPDSLGLFTDAAAPTVRVVHATGTEPTEQEGRVKELVLPMGNDQAGAEADLIAALQGLGLHRILVEGGGLTVSRFLEAGQLDRLHLIVAPVILGSGRPAFTLAPLDQLDDALRPDFRRFELGPDTLFDLSFD